jgi:hypothetical protein
MSLQGPSTGNHQLQRIIAKFWDAPENAEWTPKTQNIPLDELREWMGSSDMEIMGFAYAMMCGKRLRIEPAMSVEESVGFFKRYYERCLHENPDGKWSDFRYSIGYDLVSLFGNLWWDQEVPRELLVDLKGMLARLYKAGDEEIRTSIVQATLEHLVEQKPIRKFFSDWTRDPVLKIAYEEACLWPDGGGSTPLGRTHKHSAPKANRPRKT